MNERMVRIRIMVLFLLLAGTVVALVFSLSSPAERGSGGDDRLRIHFLDVGQGDATFIEAPGGVQVLIDGGPNDAVLRELGREMSFFDRHIDLVVATHPDADHIGGLIDVLRRYQVDTILISGKEHDTPTAETFARAVENEGATVIRARAGQRFSLSASTTLEVLFPAGDTSEMESNTASVVLLLDHHDIEALLTGDAPARIEEYLVEVYGTTLQSEILKVGHHGSDTSSSPEFLETVAPQYAVISAGRKNRYGHPHPEVLTRLSGTEVFGTYEEGTITLLSDGITVFTQ